MSRLSSSRPSAQHAPTGAARLARWMGWAALVVGLSAGAALSAAAGLKLSTNQSAAEMWVAGHLLEQIYVRAGLAVDVMPLPAERAHKDAVAGEVDGEVARIRSYGDRNPTMVRVEPAYCYITSVAVSRRASGIHVQTVDELSRYRIGVVRGVNHSLDLTERLPNVTRTQTPDQLFKMLEMDRFDIAVDSGMNARYMLARPRAEVLQASEVLMRQEMFHYLHPRHAAMRQRLSDTIKRLRASGELARMTEEAEAQVMTVDLSAFALDKR